MTDTAPARVLMSDVGAVIARLHEFGDGLRPGERAALDALLRAARVEETCPLQYNPYLLGVHSEPYPHYARLRTENPIHYSEAVGAWVLTRYADVVRTLHDPRLSAQRAFQVTMGSPSPEVRETVQTFTEFMDGAVNQLDPPEHTRLRRVLTRTLTPELVAGRRLAIQAVVDELLDAVQSRGEMDLVADFAHPLPVLAAAEVLDVPPEDRPALVRWVDDVASTFTNTTRTLDGMQRGDRAIAALMDYFRPVVQARRCAPNGDLISAMLAEGDLSDDEISRLLTLVAIGAHENLRNAITVGVFALLDAGIWTALHAEPSLIPTAVQEMLRFAAISTQVARTAIEDLEIGGHRIRAGEQVILLLAAANRDPARFAAADALDLGRRPNPHIAFGAGIHICPGAGLARTTTVAALTALLARFPDLRLTGAVPRWREERNIRGLASLPLRFSPRPGGDTISDQEQPR